MPRWTESKDGVDRCNITVKIRLDRWQYALLEAYAEHEQYDDGVAGVCKAEANLAVEGLIHDVYDDRRYADIVPTKP